MCPKIIGDVRVSILRLKKTDKIQQAHLHGNVYASVLWCLLQYANSNLKLMSIVAQCSDPQKDRQQRELVLVLFIT